MVAYAFWLACFNSRTREGCDKTEALNSWWLLLFQFTHPGGVRPLVYQGLASASLFQFTHPGGVRHYYRGVARLEIEFQFTHPGGVRLLSPIATIQPLGCFNSRTREGCDYPACFFGGASLCFNSRTREGCDHIQIICIPQIYSFNSRTREGCDMKPRKKGPERDRFQFTHPGGVRLNQARAQFYVNSFNSRTREGCDQKQAGSIPR